MNQGVGFASSAARFRRCRSGRAAVDRYHRTLGLPQMNDVNEQMRRTMDARFGNGYDYGLYPGLQKVVQAAGRVIRTEQDQCTSHR